MMIGECDEEGGEREREAPTIQEEEGQGAILIYDRWIFHVILMYQLYESNR